MKYTLSKLAFLLFVPFLCSSVSANQVRVEEIWGNVSTFLEKKVCVELPDSITPENVRIYLEDIFGVDSPEKKESLVPFFYKDDPEYKRISESLKDTRTVKESGQDVIGWNDKPLYVYNMALSKYGPQIHTESVFNNEDIKDILSLPTEILFSVKEDHFRERLKRISPQTFNFETVIDYVIKYCSAIQDALKEREKTLSKKLEQDIARKIQDISVEMNKIRADVSKTANKTTSQMKEDI